MDVDIPINLHLEIRKIRNIEIWRSDLLPLIEGNKKIPSAPINAYGAQMQHLDGKDANYTIFSSWIAALLSGMAKENMPGVGTIGEQTVRMQEELNNIIRRTSELVHGIYPLERHPVAAPR